MTNVRKNSAKLTREDLKIAPESPTMKLSETPAVEPSEDRKSTRLNSSHPNPSRMPSSA